MSTEDLEPTFWFCVKHHSVEEFDGCGSKNRIGPFATPEDAQRALQTIAERESRYEKEDSQWDGGS